MLLIKLFPAIGPFFFILPGLQNVYMKTLQLLMKEPGVGAQKKKDCHNETSHENVEEDGEPTLIKAAKEQGFRELDVGVQKRREAPLVRIIAAVWG
jgi:hypothetical protein